MPRNNFDSIVWATTTIFGVLSGENWNVNMYDAIRANPAAGVLYFITLIVFGMFIVMNIFMAILLANFDELGVKKEEVETESEDEEKTIRSVVKDIARHGAAQELAGALHLSGHEDGSRHKGSAAVAPQPSEKAGGVGALPTQEQHWLRALCRWVVTRKAFDNGILACILISSVTLAVDTPFTDPDSALFMFLYVCDLTMTIIFTIEMVMKIIGLGLLGHTEAYLNNGWNQLDGLIVIVGWIATFGDPSVKAFKACRALRALKPLRLINRRPGLQVVVGTMISSVGAIFNVAIVTILVFVIFSIMAVNYLKGRFYHCAGDGFDALTERQQDVSRSCGPFCRVALISCSSLTPILVSVSISLPAACSCRISPSS